MTDKLAGRPTPETDAKAMKTLGGEIVYADDARRLERQRDAAVELLERLCDSKRPLTWSPTVEIAEAFAHARAALPHLKGKP